MKYYKNHIHTNICTILKKKWYAEGEKSLSEREKYILALVDMDLEKLKGLGDEKL